MHFIQIEFDMYKSLRCLLIMGWEQKELRSFNMFDELFLIIKNRENLTDDTKMIEFHRFKKKNQDTQP